MSDKASNVNNLSVKVLGVSYRKQVSDSIYLHCINGGGFDKRSGQTIIIVS